MNLCSACSDLHKYYGDGVGLALNWCWIQYPAIKKSNYATLLYRNQFALDSCEDWERTNDTLAEWLSLKRIFILIDGDFITQVDRFLCRWTTINCYSYEWIFLMCFTRACFICPVLCWKCNFVVVVSFVSYLRVRLVWLW